MSRQAFRKNCSVLDMDSVYLAVTSFLLGMRPNTLFLVFLLVPIAVCSPVVPTQARPLNPSADTSMDWLLAATVQTAVQRSQPRSEFLPSVTTLLPMSSASARNLRTKTVSTEGGQGSERYPYLLLTAGLILLAFRPANSAVGGRY